MRRVGVYVDYSNVYKGARDAFALRGTKGHRGNVNPVRLAERLAAVSPTGDDRSATHTLAHTKVFRGAPDPVRDKHAALMEAKRAHQWEQWGAQVYRHALDYAHGAVVEKGVDVRLAMTLLMDVLSGEVDVVVLMSADKDFRYALLQVRDASAVEVEVASWKAIAGGRAVGRIRLRAERAWEPEVPCHLLDRHDFARLEDTVDYRMLPPPPGWA